MIEGVPGRVYFQVRTPAGKPADLKGYITDGTEKIAEIATLTDAENAGVNRGHGVFTLTPKAGAKYFLKLDLAQRHHRADEGRLPAPGREGRRRCAHRARRGDGEGRRRSACACRSRRARRRSTSGRTPAAGSSLTRSSKSRPARRSRSPLKGDDAAGGVTRVTVFEEPAVEGPGRAQLIPRAERLVYRAPGEQLILNVNPDKARYTPAGKVRLELVRVTTRRKQPTPAVLLVGGGEPERHHDGRQQDRPADADALPPVGRGQAPRRTGARRLPPDRPPEGRRSRSTCLLGTQGWRRFAEQTGSPRRSTSRTSAGGGPDARGPRPADHRARWSCTSSRNSASPPSSSRSWSRRC